MYDILELNKKLLPELRQIAKELKIKRVESYKKQELIYKILDEQAIQSTQSKKSVKKERVSEKTASKRPRIRKNQPANNPGVKAEAEKSSPNKDKRSSSQKDCKSREGADR